MGCRFSRAGGEEPWEKADSGGHGGEDKRVRKE